MLTPRKANGPPLFECHRLLQAGVVSVGTVSREALLPDDRVLLTEILGEAIASETRFFLSTHVGRLSKEPPD